MCVVIVLYGPFATGTYLLTTEWSRFFLIARKRHLLLYSLHRCARIRSITHQKLKMTSSEWNSGRTMRRLRPNCNSYCGPRASIAAPTRIYGADVRNALLLLRWCRYVNWLSRPGLFIWKRLLGLRCVLLCYVRMVSFTMLRHRAYVMYEVGSSEL